MQYKNFSFISRLCFLLVFVFLPSCQTSTISRSSSAADPPAFIPPTSSPTETPVASTELNISDFTAWIDPSLPGALRDQVMAIDNLEFSDSDTEASIKFQSDSGYNLGSWIYLVVAPFHSFLSEISKEDLLSIWFGEFSSHNDNPKLFLSAETKKTLTKMLGDPNDVYLQVIEPHEFISDLWSNPSTLAIIPFEELTLDWKVLSIEGIDPLSANFDNMEYILSLPVYAKSKDLTLTTLQLKHQISNYDPSKFTSIALTGVTALVRDTASIMEEKGITYPAEDIKDILGSASITHISNEVPFAEDCPTPNPDQESFYFCSKDSYIELLEAVGADIIELSGDHFADWGIDAMLHTLDLYDEQGWRYYGGGENLQAGLMPLIIEHNGNSFAFIGCNGKTHDKYATATNTNPGASRCDFDWMTDEIKRLASTGHIVIATMQHEEVDSYYSIAIQQYDFGRLAESGAIIVSGSQSHHPQAFDYTGTSFIHYGLGNLFFDQWFLANYNPTAHINKDKAFIDIHYFYDGNHINTRFITLQFIDNAKPRLMTSEEDQEFLTEVFKYSIWKDQPLPSID